jgi:hypothetical protein
MKLKFQELKTTSRHIPDDSHVQLRLPLGVPLDDESHLLVDTETGGVIYFERLSPQLARSRDITDSAVGRILTAHWGEALQEGR